MPVLLLLYRLSTGARLGRVVLFLLCNHCRSCAWGICSIFFWILWQSHSLLIHWKLWVLIQMQWGLQPVKHFWISRCLHPNFRYLPKLAWGDEGLLCHKTNDGIFCRVDCTSNILGACETDRGCMDTAFSFWVPLLNPVLLYFWVLISFFTLCTSSLHLVHVFKHFSPTQGQNTSIF